MHVDSKRILNTIKLLKQVEGDFSRVFRSCKYLLIEILVKLLLESIIKTRCCAVSIANAD